MDSSEFMEQTVPAGLLTHLKFGVLHEADIERYSVVSIDMVNDVTNPKLGCPNLSDQCATCGARDVESCDGHLGIIRLPMDIFHPYFISEVVQILNRICPGCKSIKDDFTIKGSATMAKTSRRPKGCNYCSKRRNSSKWYPKMKFKVASRNSSGKIASAVVVEANGKLPSKFQGEKFTDVLPADYWNFIKKDPCQEEGCLEPNMKILSPGQVYYLLKDVDPKNIEQLVLSRESLFLTSFPVTSNSNRVMERTHVFSSGKNLDFDDRTKAYKKLVDFKGQADELASRVRDCLNVSKLISVKSSNTDRKSGLKWMKEVVLGKLTDYAFRMVVAGDPNIKLHEIGMPQDICQRLLIPENLNERNWETVNASCNVHLLERGVFYIRRNGHLVSVESMDGLQIGDTVYRPLDEGDFLLVNRPPSIHQHSLIALQVHVLPLESVVCLNPVCCTPFRGDFDGDCIHGFIPQSIRSRVELRELVSMDHQLINGQNGRNLLSLCHDSKTAAYQLREKDVYLNKFQMQQLAVFCQDDLPCPAILKAPENQTPVWTGNQLFSMLLPHSFDYISPSDSIHINRGEIISSSLESSWLQDTQDNIFHSLSKCYGSKSLDILLGIQKSLLEWISMRGFSVSLSDLYLCSDSYSRTKMMNEVHCCLREAEQSFHLKQFMVDPLMECLLIKDEENQDLKGPDVGRANYPFEKTVISQVSIDAFREVFRDIQNILPQYSSKDNSLLAMLKAGSKGNFLRLVQQSISLGLQYSNDALPFRVPCGSSCAIWNREKALGYNQNARDIHEYSQSKAVAFAVIHSSFLSGLNPSECFFHSLTSRYGSFADNADVPGTLSRKLMFYMRDLSLAYDGTVRNPYGNQIVQFSYDASEDTFVQDNDSYTFFGENTLGSDGFGSPVGSLAACSIQEAAYSALDQPISMLESSPLMNIKKLLESVKKLKPTSDQTISLFLSKNLGRRLYGFEYGALKIKSQLERVLFSDVVSTVMIVFSQQKIRGMHLSPWICHFHLSKEEMRRRELNVPSVVQALNQKCNSTGEKAHVVLPKLQILNGCCLIGNQQKEDVATVCVAVAMETSKSSPLPLDTVQDLMIPFLLETVVKGLAEFKKVDILWKDLSDASTSRNDFQGELYMKVYVSENCKIRNCWAHLLNGCINIMDLIDWGRSHPDNIHDIFSAYGIGVAWKHYLRNLKAAISDTGKTILPRHLLLVADTLSITGEFLGLNPKGIARLRNQTSVSSPFMQACFSNPGTCFINAAKKEAEDSLLGSLDAAVWGKEIPVGTSGRFDILYSGKEHQLAKPVDAFEILSRHRSQEKNAGFSVQPDHIMFDKWGAKPRCTYVDPVPERLENIKPKPSPWTYARDAIVKRCLSLRKILHKYSINEYLNETDKSTLIDAIHFHPRSSEKIGTGLQDIKIGTHQRFQNSRCFMLVRTDGSMVDISYRKCIMGAARAGLPPQVVEPLRKALFQNVNGYVDY